MGTGDWGVVGAYTSLTSEILLNCLAAGGGGLRITERGESKKDARDKEPAKNWCWFIGFNSFTMKRSIAEQNMCTIQE